MEMANCKRCKKLFPRVTDFICESCKSAEEKLFDDVREFLKSNPNSTIDKISAETGASAKRILTWLREGRLEVAKTLGVLVCRKCAEPIKTGMYCERCFIIMSKHVEDVLNPQEKEPAEDLSAKPLETPAGQRAVMHTSRRRR